MKVVLVAVGRLRPPLRDVCDDYLRRFGKHVTIEEREVREVGATRDPATRRDLEGERLLAAVPAGAAITVLDQEGTGYTSEALARCLDGWRTSARDRALLIGGATGFSSAVRQAATDSWSLGPLTLPHEIARVIVAEQLYRASTILRGEPYHRADR